MNIIKKFAVIAVVVSAFLVATPGSAVANDPNYPPDPGCTWVFNGTTWVQECEPTEPEPNPALETCLLGIASRDASILRLQREVATREATIFVLRQENAELLARVNTLTATVDSLRDRLAAKNKKIRELREQLRNN